jgi:hypothetical protein
MSVRVNRRAFLKALGVGAGVATLGRVLGWGQPAPVKVGLIGPHQSSGRRESNGARGSAGPR